MDPVAAAKPLAARAGTGPVRVLVLRHGQSEWNAVHRWQGTADSPLTALGREQAIETAWSLAGLDIGFAVIWSSHLRRAARTASIIGGALSLPAPILDARFREAHAGEWEGLTPADIEIVWPGWLSTHRRPASFEPFADVVERAVAALHDVAHDTRDAEGSPAALVVAHSGVIRSIVRHLGRHDERVPNLGGIWLTVDVASPPDPSVTPLATDGITLDDVFDPAGIVISGVDAPGEDPADEPDQSDAHGRA